MTHFIHTFDYVQCTSRLSRQLEDCCKTNGVDVLHDGMLACSS